MQWYCFKSPSFLMKFLRCCLQIISVGFLPGFCRCRREFSTGIFFPGSLPEFLQGFLRVLLKLLPGFMYVFFPDFLQRFFSDRVHTIFAGVPPASYSRFFFCQEFFMAYFDKVIAGYLLKFQQRYL